MMLRKSLLCIVLCLSLIITSVYAQEIEFDGKTVDEITQQYGEAVMFDNDGSKGTLTDIYIGTPYDESSRDGFIEYINTDGSKYLYRVRYIKLNQIDYGDITQAQHIISVPIGQTYTTSTTTTISRTVSNSWSFGASESFSILEDAINIELTQQYTSERSKTTSYTVSKGTTYTFPSNAPAGYNIAHFYAGFIHDKYDTVADIVKFVAKEKLTRVISMDPDPNLPNKLMILELEDGRTEIIPIRALDQLVRDGYYVEEEHVYDYENMESYSGELLAPKPITFTLFGNI